MSRTLTSTAETSTETALGTEPILLVAIKWDGEDPIYYADKDLTVGTIVADGRVLEVGSINIQQKQVASGAVGTISVTLDDCDGVMKTLLDSTAIENTPITVYQHYDGNAEADLFKLFEGVITNPIEWSEGERILRFDAETRVDDQITGYALEQTTEFIQISVAESRRCNPEATNQAWPIVFGSPIRYPAPKVLRAPETVLSQAFKSGDTSFTVESGDEFTVGDVFEMEIEGVLFWVRYNGGVTFNFWAPPSYAANYPRYQALDITTRDSSDVDFQNPRAFWLLNYANDPVSLVGQYIRIADGTGLESQVHYVEAQEGAKVILRDPFQLNSGEYYLLGTGFRVAEASLVPLTGWTFTFNEPVGLDNSSITITDGVVTSFEWNFPAGTVVRKWMGSEYLVAGIGLNTVHAVYARRNGVVTQIPDEYYDLTPNASWKVFDIVTGLATTFYNGTDSITVSIVKFNRPLWQLDGQGWDVSQFWISATGPVGSNTSDQIKHLVDTYSLLNSDASSFSTVKTALTNYPSNWALLEQAPVITLIEEIAFQCRCAILVTDGAVKLKYLSADPTSILSIAEGMVEYKSLSLGFTSAEDVVTRLIGRWKPTYDSRDYAYVRDTNISIYGLRRQETDFYIYNHSTLVKKSVDFWATRLGNVWRLVRFNNFLQALKAEVFDAVTLGFTDTSLLGIASIKGVIQAHEYNVDDGTVGLEVWLPSVAGSTSVHSDAWLDDSGDSAPSNITVYTQTDPDYTAIPKERTNKTSPAIVTRVLDAATDPAALLAAGSHLVDIYGFGYSNPATRTNVPADPLGEGEELEVDARVMVFEVPTSNKAVVPVRSYMVSSATSTGAASFAKVTLGSAAGRGVSSYTVDVYGDTVASLSEDPTSEDQTAIADDPSVACFYVGEIVATQVVGGTRKIFKLLTHSLGSGISAGVFAIRPYLGVLTDHESILDYVTAATSTLQHPTKDVMLTDACFEYTTLRTLFEANPSYNTLNVALDIGGSLGAFRVYKNVTPVFLAPSTVYSIVHIAQIENESAHFYADTGAATVSGSRPFDLSTAVYAGSHQLSPSGSGTTQTDHDGAQAISTTLTSLGVPFTDLTDLTTLALTATSVVRKDRPVSWLRPLTITSESGVNATASSVGAVHIDYTLPGSALAPGAESNGGKTAVLAFYHYIVFIFSDSFRYVDYTGSANSYNSNETTRGFGGSLIHYKADGTLSAATVPHGFGGNHQTGAFINTLGVTL